MATNSNDFWQWYYNNGIIPNVWKGITGQQSSDLQSKENLQYQMLKDARDEAKYLDETTYNRKFAEEEQAYNRAFQEEEQAYNRQFALDEQSYNRAWQEEERQYNRALQQKIFDREDTAIARQMNQLSEFGINPLSQQLNGIGSGQIVSSPSSPSTIGGSSINPYGSFAGEMSNKEGQGMHNTAQIMDMASPFLSLLNTIDSINTQGVQRDLLQSQVDQQNLNNQMKVLDLQYYDDYLHQRNRDMTSSANRNEREDYIQREQGGHDNDSIVGQITTDVGHRAKNALDSIIQSATPVIENVKGKAKNLKNDYNNFIDSTSKKIDNTIDLGKDKTNYLLNNAKNKINNLHSKVEDGLTGLLNDAFNAYSSTYKRAKNYINSKRGRK